MTHWLRQPVIRRYSYGERGQNAAASVTNSVSVSAVAKPTRVTTRATDPPTVDQLPDLTIAKSHSGNFTQVSLAQPFDYGY